MWRLILDTISFIWPINSHQYWVNGRLVLGWEVECTLPVRCHKYGVGGLLSAVTLILQVCPILGRKERKGTARCKRMFFVI